MERYHEIVDYNRCLYDCSAKHRIAALETQLALANEDARLQRALRSIAAAGYDYILAETEIDIHRYKDDSRTIIRAATDVEAAEEAELWITEHAGR